MVKVIWIVYKLLCYKIDTFAAVYSIWPVIVFMIMTEVRVGPAIVMMYGAIRGAASRAGIITFTPVVKYRPHLRSRKYVLQNSFRDCLCNQPVTQLSQSVSQCEVIK